MLNAQCAVRNARAHWPSCVVLLPLTEAHSPPTCSYPPPLPLPLTLPPILQILKELHRSCQNEDGTDDQKKGTQLLEVYAIEIQMHTETKNNKKLKARGGCAVHIVHRALQGDPARVPRL